MIKNKINFRGFKKLFKSPSNFIKSIQVAMDSEAIIIRWPSDSGASTNFGDKLNPYLVEKITGKRVYNAPDIWNILGRQEYKVIGSSLGSALDESVVVWGTGFISYEKRPKAKPVKICAVRGPLSRQKYLDAGIDCPAIYGDVALLLPRFLNFNAEKKYKIGFISQWREADLPITKDIQRIESLKIIDITDSIENFVKDVISCEKIITSSLHALIISDAYQVPSLWLRVSDEPMGDWFKFQDYYESIGYKNIQPETIECAEDVLSLSEKCVSHKIDLDLNKLLEACPFIDKNK